MRTVSGRKTPSRRRLATALALVGSLFAARGAMAQDEGDIVREATRLRSPALRGEPDKLLEVVTYVLRRDVKRADDVLREVLRDTSKQASEAVEAVVVGTIHDTPDRRLLPEVVERLRIEQGSALDLRMDSVFRRYSDMELVEQLTALARDADRPIAYRNACLRTLGRTELDGAVSVLLDFWGGPEKELHAQAARSFRYLLPHMPNDYEQAATVMESIRKEGLPMVVVLRDAVRRIDAKYRRERERSGDTSRERAHVKSLLELLPVLGLDEVVKVYLRSPAEELREAGARRLVELKYDGPKGAEEKRAAASACLRVLVSEGSEPVDLALLEAATALAKSVRGRVEMPWMEAVKTRVQLHERFSRRVQLAAVGFLGALRDPGRRSLPLLKERFESLADTDAEFRLALLSSIESVSSTDTAAVVDWLVARGRAERNEQVLARILIALGVKENARNAEVVAFFRAVLANGDHSEDVHSNAGLVLASYWRAGEEAARDALLEVGLSHGRVTVRKASASELGSRYAKVDNGPTIVALRKLLVREQDVGVRKAAARSIVELDLDHAAENLVDSFSDPEVWGVYVKHLVERMNDDVRPDVAVAHADFLVSKGNTSKALALLEEMVAARPDKLWPGAEERGVVRRRLVEMNLEQQQFEPARPYAKALADASTGGDGPVHVWRLLWGRTLVGIGGDDLATAQQVLFGVAYADDLPANPPGLKTLALFELARCMEEQKDWKRANMLFVDARGNFPEIPAIPANAKPVERRRLERVREPLLAIRRELQERIDGTAKKAVVESARVLEEYVPGLGGNSATSSQCRSRLQAMNHRAAVYILDALGGPPVKPAYDDEMLERMLGIKTGHPSQTQLRNLIQAAAIIKGAAPHTIPEDQDDDQWARLIHTARKQLYDQIIIAWPER